MTKSKTSLKVIIISFITIAIILGSCIYGLYVVLLGGVPTNKIISQFNENLNCFDNVATYLEKETKIYDITYSNGKLLFYDMSVIENNQIIEITDEKVHKALVSILHDLKYKRIEIYEDEIYFLKGVHLSGNRGIKYIRNGGIPYSSAPQIYELIKGNWYYYYFSNG